MEQITQAKLSSLGQDKTPIPPSKLVIASRVSFMGVSCGTTSHDVQLYRSRRYSYRVGVHKDQGAFAEYVRADAAITWKIPDSISYEEAVTVSVGVLTCIQAMFHPKRLGLVQYPNQVPGQPWVCFSRGPCHNSPISVLVRIYSSWLIACDYTDSDIRGEHCGWSLCNSTRSDVRL